MKRIAHYFMILMTVSAVVGAATPALAQKAKPGGGGAGSTAAYTILPFSPPGAASTESFITDLNDAGDVIGYTAHSDQPQRFWHLHLPSGIYTELATELPVYFHAINAHGHMVGWIWISSEEQPYEVQPYFTPLPGDDPVLLEGLPGYTRTFAEDINDDGIIVGYSNGPETSTAAVWRRRIQQDATVVIDGPLPLAPLDGHISSFAYRINNPRALDPENPDGPKGPMLVTGISSANTSVNGPMQAVVWEVNVAEDGSLEVSGPLGLGTLGLLPPEQTSSSGHGINAWGDVCGRSDWRPFVHAFAGGMQALPFPRDTKDGDAQDINDAGAIVGQLDISKTNWPNNYAYLWRGGKGYALEKEIGKDTGWDRLWRAERINNGGVITGYGRYDVQNRGFILVPNSP
jgi:hypothetical protein